MARLARHPVGYTADEVHENVAHGLPLRTGGVESVYERRPVDERRALPERGVLEARVGREVGHRRVIGDGQKPTTRQRKRRRYAEDPSDSSVEV